MENLARSPGDASSAIYVQRVANVVVWAIRSATPPVPARVPGLLIVCLILENIWQAVVVCALPRTRAQEVPGKCCKYSSSWGINIFSSNISRHYWNYSSWLLVLLVKGDQEWTWMEVPSNSQLKWYLV